MLAHVGREGEYHFPVFEVELIVDYMVLHFLHIQECHRFIPSIQIEEALGLIAK